MAILYYFNPDVPDGIDMFPPSVMKSDWYASITADTQRLNIGGGWLTVIIFANLTELNNYLDKNRLTDPALLADVAAWKNAHNITYTTSYFNLDNANITPLPSPIVSL